MQWLIDDKEDPRKGVSLFKKEYNRDAGYYTNKTFEPEFRRDPAKIIPLNR